MRAVAARLPSRPAVLSLDPSRLGDVLGDAITLGERLRRRGGRAPAAGRMQARIDAVRTATADAEPVRVAAIEWLDPPYCAGHWLPEMIAAAGGIDALAAARASARGRSAGTRSRPLGRTPSWSCPAASTPTEAEAEARRHAALSQALGAGTIHAVDAASSFSRPGPRLADGVELLGHLLHPDAGPRRPLGLRRPARRLIRA